jgi:transcriptional regulator with XRE-family HTH domain
MNAQRLKNARLAGGWTQSEAAAKLGVSQPYYSQLENGSRPLSGELGPIAVLQLQLSPVALPLPELHANLAPLDPREIAAQFGSLLYPGFTHMKKAAKPLNPALLVAASLAHPDLDPRLVEALPWALFTFHDLDWDWLSAQCRLGNQQNRLGYLVTLAMQFAKPGANANLANALSDLERSRLAVEGTLCRESMPTAERTWARKHRPTDAAHWNLLTTLTADQLTHAA